MSQIMEVREKIIDFLRYHEEHARFYELAYEKADALEAEADALKSLAIRWVEARAVGAEDDNSQAIKCKTGCNIAFVKGDGFPFIEGDELDELARLKGNLKLLAGCFEAMRPWLVDVKKSSENTFPLPSNDATFNQLYIQQFVILNNEHAALHDFLFIAEVLRKACDLLESIDSSRGVFRDDLIGTRFIPKLLLVASAMVEGGAKFARLAADLIRANETRWKDFDEKAVQLNLRTKGVKLTQVS